MVLSIITGLRMSGSAGMQVWAHPHTGLQTVSWLLDGEIEHRESRLAGDGTTGSSTS